MVLPRNAQLWLPGYVRSEVRSLWNWRGTDTATRVWLTFADHFEPYWGGVGDQAARNRVDLWRRRWPEIATRHRDSTGRPPRYTFFYPEEQYRPHLLAPLAEMVEDGIADVEVHLHHDGEGERDFVERIRRFTETLFTRHGLLRQHNGKIAFGFIHGNWALDNSRPDGRWCGLNNEISLLRDLGCYADFTLPSAPSATQARTVNTIYWATDDPECPKSHDTGVPVRPGTAATGDLLMIPGPLGVNWRGRGRLLPRLETGELAAHDPSTRDRCRSWLRLAPRIGADVFIKLFSHGAQERNAAALLGGELDRCLEGLRSECERRGNQLFFASAWEMWLAVEAVRCLADPTPDMDRAGKVRTAPCVP